MPTLSIVQQWLGDQIVPVFFIGFALLMGIAMVYLSAQSRRASLVRDRSGMTAETFADSLAAYGFDPEIARTTYVYLQEAQRVEFPIDPRDDLDRDLGMDSEDVKRTVRELLDDTGREYLPGLLDSPLATVVDLVRYIQASPRREVMPGRRIA
jgi:acyl carrier protein